MSPRGYVMTMSERWRELGLPGMADFDPVEYWADTIKTIRRAKELWEHAYPVFTHGD